MLRRGKADMLSDALTSFYMFPENTVELYPPENMFQLLREAAVIIDKNSRFYKDV